MVAVEKIEYVAYGQPDLAETERFLVEFGLTVAQSSPTEVIMRGADGGHCYIARAEGPQGLQSIGMRVRSMAELEEAAGYPEASPIAPIERPGGGNLVRLTSPDGIVFELVQGAAPAAAHDMRSPLVLNHAREKRRQGGSQRPALEPAMINRLGHVALLTADYRRNADWLADRLGLRPSDVLFDGDPSNMLGGFFHCGGAGGWTDHHTIALFPAERPGVHHCSFEVLDLDAQFMGNKYLKLKGRTPFWGVGRHILGSQIFDYWLDPAGNIVEHFADTDVVLPGTQPGFHQVSDDSLAMWGPPIAVADFIGGARRG